MTEAWMDNFPTESVLYKRDAEENAVTKYDTGRNVVLQRALQINYIEAKDPF
jgi:hypothetical protein